MPRHENQEITGLQEVGNLGKTGDLLEKLAKSKSKQAVSSHVLDYIERATCHCVALPYHLKFENFEKWVEENATTTPVNMRLYIEKDFSEDLLTKVKNLALNSFDSVFFVEIPNLSKEEIEAIEEFAYTYFEEQQVVPRELGSIGKSGGIGNIGEHGEHVENFENIKLRDKPPTNPDARILPDDEDANIKFGNGVKKARLDKKMPIGELASKINMKLRYVVDIERGQVTTDANMKFRIAHALGTTIADLCGLPIRVRTGE